AERAEGRYTHTQTHTHTHTSEFKRSRFFGYNVGSNTEVLDCELSLFSDLSLLFCLPVFSVLKLKKQQNCAVCDRDTQRHTETHRDTQRHTETHRDTQRQDQKSIV